jgi:hypothetical protein
MIAGVVGLKGSLLTPKGLELYNLTINNNPTETLHLQIYSNTNKNTIIKVTITKKLGKSQPLSYWNTAPRASGRQSFTYRQKCRKYTLSILDHEYPGGRSVGESLLLGKSHFSHQQLLLGNELSFPWT